VRLDFVMETDDPYSAPISSVPAGKRTQAKASKLARMGAWMQLLPVLGLLGTLVGIVRAYADLDVEGLPDPGSLSVNIGEVLIWTAFGFWGGLVGCGLLGFAVFVQGVQARWIKVFFGLSLIPALMGVWMAVVMIRTWGVG
jgi:hypothetical protein